MFELLRGIQNTGIVTPIECTTLKCTDYHHLKVSGILYLAYSSVVKTPRMFQISRGPKKYFLSETFLSVCLHRKSLSSSARLTILL